jgi:hypothetical protein
MDHGDVLLQAPEQESRPTGDIRLRLKVWRRRGKLDAELAEGRHAAGDPELGLRARQLTRSTTRVGLARTLRNLLDAAEEPPDTWSFGDPRPPLRRDAVLAAHDELTELAERLAAPGDVPPQAAALTSLMVWDSASPVYAADPRASVIDWAVAALDALDGDGV